MSFSDINIFHQQPAILVMSRNTDKIAFSYIDSYFSSFFRILKSYFSEHGSNFDDVRKIGYSRPS